MERLEIEIGFSRAYYAERFGLRYEEDYSDNPSPLYAQTEGDASVARQWWFCGRDRVEGG